MRNFRLSLNYQDLCSSSYFSRHRFTLTTFQIDEKQKKLMKAFSHSFESKACRENVSPRQCIKSIFYKSHFINHIPCFAGIYGTPAAVESLKLWPLHKIIITCFVVRHVSLNSIKNLWAIKNCRCWNSNQLQIRSVFVTGFTLEAPVQAKSGTSNRQREPLIHLSQCAEKCI